MGPSLVVRLHQPVNLKCLGAAAIAAETSRITEVPEVSDAFRLYACFKRCKMLSMSRSGIPTRPM